MNKITLFLLLFLFSCNEKKEEICTGGTWVIQESIVGDKKGGTLKSMRIPKTTIGWRTTKDYLKVKEKEFNGSFTAYSLYNSLWTSIINSYNNSFVTILNDHDKKLLFLYIKPKGLSSFFVLKFKTQFITDIEFKGLSKEKNYYFIVKHKKGCTKMCITKRKGIHISDY